jgi:hypothetical protein
VPIAAALSWSACGSSPTAPPGGLTQPTLVSPAMDALVGTPTTLVVQNASSTLTGPRTYDFQVAESSAALDGPSSGLVTAASGLAEGAAGQTQFVVGVTLVQGRQYFWHARAVQANTQGPWSSSFSFITNVSNSPPVIQSITPASNRSEVNGDVLVTAQVTDQETSPSNLVYNWTASGGSFTGTGSTVHWHAPASGAPALFTLTLTVVENYTVTIPGGKSQTGQNQTSASIGIHVNDSTKEITNLVLTFLDDFVHSERTPEFCVRNFSDNCSGKEDELSDIESNRANFIQDPARSGASVSSITFDNAVQPTFSTVLAPCHFAATNKSTGVFGIANGTCRLTTVYENFNWFLCVSNFDPISFTSEAMKKLFRF